MMDMMCRLSRLVCKGVDSHPQQTQSAPLRAAVLATHPTINRKEAAMDEVITTRLAVRRHHASSQSRLTRAR
jgi:hypothetical protein